MESAAAHGYRSSRPASAHATLSHVSTSNEHYFSTAFQFSDMIGVGVAFGSQQQFQMGYRFEHLSNASIKRPNPGTDLNELYLRYTF
ncbi:acyloxyacyl hydrolase [Cupriavidus basilensis]